MFIMISVNIYGEEKNSLQFVSMGVAAILDFRSIIKVHIYNR